MFVFLGQRKPTWVVSLPLPAGVGAGIPQLPPLSVYTPIGVYTLGSRFDQTRRLSDLVKVDSVLGYASTPAHGSFLVFANRVYSNSGFLALYSDPRAAKALGWLDKPDLPHQPASGRGWVKKAERLPLTPHPVRGGVLRSYQPLQPQPALVSVNTQSHVLWLKPKLQVQRLQLLSPDVGVFDKSAAPKHASTFYYTSVMVAAVLGYSRRYRRLFFIQQCLFRHVRRCLLVLNPNLLDVVLLGVMPKFRLL